MGTGELQVRLQLEPNGWLGLAGKWRRVGHVSAHGFYGILDGQLGLGPVDGGDQ